MLDKIDKKFFIQLSTYFKNEKNLIAFSKIQEIASSISKNSLTAEKLLKRLEDFGFIDLIFTDKQGEPFVYIVILKIGKDFLQRKKERRKEVLIRISLAFLSAILTFIFGKILYAIFS